MGHLMLAAVPSGGRCNDGSHGDLGERILEAIRYAPLDDDVLAKRLGIPHRQAVNQAARRKIVNALPAQTTPRPSISPPLPASPSVAPRQAPPFWPL